MSVKNPRQKGRAFVKKIIEILRQEVDTSTYEVVGSGAGLDKGDIRIPTLNLVIEAKDWKKPELVSWINQSDKEGLGYSKTALMWKLPTSPSSSPDIRVDLSLDYFCELLKKNQAPLVKEPDKELTYLLKNLKENIRRVLNKIE